MAHIIIDDTPTELHILKAILEKGSYQAKSRIAGQVKAAMHQGYISWRP